MNVKRHAGLVLVIAFVGALVAACGLPNDAAPRIVAADKVPSTLLGPSTTNNPDSGPGGTDVRLYFFFTDASGNTQLRPVRRTVPRRDIGVVLEQLVKGPAETDPFGGASSIPKDTKIVRTTSDGSTVTIVLSNEILNIAGAEQLKAFAQLVYTATDLGASGVLFRVVDANGNNEQDLKPTTDQGQKDGPLTRADFQKVANT